MGLPKSGLGLPSGNLGSPPAAHSMPTFIKLRPMTKSTEPVTTGGKKRSNFPISGAQAIPIKPEAIIAPKIPVIPKSGLTPMAIMGATAVKVTPIIIGRRMPKKRLPKHWTSVASPAANKSALIISDSLSFGKSSAAPRMSGTIIQAEYITKTCCSPITKVGQSANFSSTG